VAIQPGTEPTSDDKLLGGLSHFFGGIVALIIWAVQKDKSPFVRFQALQAVAFDAVFIVIFGIGFACLFALIFGSATLGTLGIGAAAATGDETAGGAVAALSGLFFFIPFAGQCVLLAIMGVFFVGRIIAAISTFQGHHFRYPVLGERLEKMLNR
jgi:uncharacterized membrane protein